MFLTHLIFASGQIGICKLMLAKVTRDRKTLHITVIQDRLGGPQNSQLTHFSNLHKNALENRNKGCSRTINE